MDFALHPGRLRPDGADPAYRGQAAFALLLVLMLTAVLGGAVLAAQLIVQQRLRTVAQRNLRYQQQVATDAALRHLMATLPPDEETFPKITAAVPLPDRSQVAFVWKTAPTSSAAIPAGARRIRAEFRAETGDDVDYQQDYIIWRDGDGRPRMARW